MGDSVPQHTGPNSLTDTLPRTERLRNPTDHQQKNHPRWKAFYQRHSSYLPLQLLGVEIDSFLPNR
jgi:hypothetical protein